MRNVVELINVKLFLNFRTDIVIFIRCGYVKAVGFTIKIACSLVIYISMTGIRVRICIFTRQAVLRTVIILRSNFLNSPALIVIKSTGGFTVLCYTECSTCFIINIRAIVTFTLSIEYITHLIICICGNGSFCFIIFNCNIRFLSYITACVIFIRYGRAVTVFFLSHSALIVISVT